MYSKTAQLANDKPKKRKKKSHHKILVDECDQLVRDIIKRRDARCCTCKKTREQARLDVGHYIKRRFQCLKWDLRNCHAQCSGCNYYHNINAHPYTLFIARMYGIGILEEFDEIVRNHTRFTISDLEEIKAGLEEELASYSEVREVIEVDPLAHELNVSNEGTDQWW